MITLSLCMIIKDEELVLDRCLKSIYDAVDEIIIVDTGSTDNSKNICKKYTENIYDYIWNDDFSAARNFSFEKATKDYILWLDADEIIDEENKEKLLNLKQVLSLDIDVVTMHTCMNIDECNNPQITMVRNRIVKREDNFKWIGFVHEYIEASGNVYDSDICIIHDKVKPVSDRNLKIYKKKVEEKQAFSERDLYYYGKELYCNKYYNEAIKVLEEFVSKGTWEDEIIDALCKIGECYLCKDDKEIARKYFYKTFEYGPPQGEILYKIAYSFQDEEKYDRAISWYEIILSLPIPDDCCQCRHICCLRFKPHLNLCYCYFKVGDLNQAYYHHKNCMKINPNDPCVKYNESCFKLIMKNNKV